MSRVADVHNNPFFVDDQTFPPQHSAFAILLAERDDLLEMTPDELLKRAQDFVAEDPHVAAVYGKSINDADLKSAAARLKDPADRLVNEILDFRFHSFQLDAIPELAQALERFRQAYAKWEEPELVDLSMVAAILLRDLPPLERAPLRRSMPQPPELPTLTEMLQRVSS